MKEFTLALFDTLVQLMIIVVACKVMTVIFGAGNVGTTEIWQIVAVTALFSANRAHRDIAS